MHQPLSKAEIATINGADRFVSGEPTDDRFVIDAGPQWFSRIAQQMLQPKPGLVLHLLTDCGERNGHRYASGETPVPSYVVRTLLRSEHGEQWLAAIMDSCTAPWWLDLRRAADIGRKVLNLTREE